MDNKTPFLPARGKEADILQSTPTNGMVWFATDTRKIYYSNGESFVSMGGNSGIYYGRMTLDYTPEENEKEFDFTPEEIEGNEEDGIQIIPNPDDLIFNSPDNSFYRVLEVYKDEQESIIIHTRLLTVAGSGGGSGSGGTGSGTMVVSFIGSSNLEIVEGAECSIGFNFSAVDAAGDQTGVGVARIYVNSALKDTVTIPQGDNYFSIGKYLELGNNIVKVEIDGNIGGTSTFTSTKKWAISVSKLSLTWEYEDTTINTNSIFNFRYQVSTSLSHQIHIIIDDLYSIVTPAVASSTSQIFSINRVEYGLTHGAHKVKMYATAQIGGKEQSSNVVAHTIICVDEDSPIVSINYSETIMNQYDTIAIPVIVYDPNITENINCRLYIDTVEVDYWTNLINGSSNLWYYTPSAPGTHRLMVSYGNIEDFIDIQASFSSNALLESWEQNGINLTFSEGFDWINGGLKTEIDDNGQRRNYICVKAGNTITINYQLFNVNPLVGKTFKFIFKATNCRNYDAKVLECYDTTTSRGIIMRAQDTIIQTSTDSISTPYCEDSFIEFEYDIWGVQASNGGRRYVMPWLDGVPASIGKYTDETLFGQAKNITIGSDDCDVYIYLVKVYNRHLSDEEHLANFIADATNSEEMLARYHRNDILDDATGDISFTKLALANPKLKVFLYDISKMSKTKKDPVSGCSYRQYYGSDQPEVTAENVEIKVQGTSSAAYGLAAFNLDSEFKEGFYVNGEHVDNYSMTPDSIPVNYLNTKVNVASCEGFNNAINQEWYNKYQPYICEYRAKNSKARDTMEFPFPGILFIRDHNETTDANDVSDNVFKDTSGYIQNPYYKMYAICNMGNSKKNKKVFHDSTNLYECCVENGDNQKPQQWMTSLTGINRDDIEQKIGDDTIYEFRYVPEATKLQHSHAWYDLVEWFMMNDPSPYNAETHPHGYTGEVLPESVVYGDYTFKGYTSERRDLNTNELLENQYTPERQILQGLKITRFTGTYTHDTYEYRMAKLLNECEDHLIMDAMVFHYLMLERHCMVDNVAKNTFWATEDMKHWSMIKDYDNDTADGIDNNGKQTRTYGLELLDKLPGKDEMVFNATDSVWLHFVDGLFEVRKAMYQALDGADGPWAAKSYLKIFDEYQSAIPERCWIEDYYRKYRRPLEVYNDPDFDWRLAGGKKTHQRKQFEVYQEKYMSSEYQGITCLTNHIDIRGNDVPQGESSDQFVNKVIKIKMYADCYVQAAFGSGQNPNIGENGRGIRVKRNQEVDVVSPIQNMNDATIYFYLAEYITSIKGLQSLVAKSVSFAQATRLRDLELGGEIQNLNLETASFGANKMLENLNIRNCPNAITSLNLKDLVALKTLDTRGSGFTSVAIASNAPITSLQLNAIGTLNLSNLYNLSTFTLDSYDNLAIIILDNIDNSQINSMTIVKEALNNALTNYYLGNVQWQINNNDELTTPPAAIIILNNLLNKEPIIMESGVLISSNRARALTGSLIIDSSVSIGYNSDNALDIYNYYAFGETNNELNFPSLNINFAADNLRLYNVNIYNRKDELIWNKKLAANGEINTAFLASGPNGAFDISSISNDQDIQYIYNFKGSWTIKIDDDIIQVSDDSLLPIYSQANNFENDIDIYPIYEKIPRQYIATFIVDGQTTTYNADYDTFINDIANNAFPNGIIKSDDNLPLNYTYRFLGWALIQDSSNIIDSNVTLKGNTTYYAVFEEIDVHNNINLDLFDIRDLDATHIEISPKNASALSGKVTIPKEIDGKIVSSLYNFKYCQNLTHIFFQTGSQLKTITGECFTDLSNLIYLEPNNSLETIEANAFRNTNLQIDLQDEDYIIGGDNLQTIGTEAFRFALHSSSPNRTVIIPSSVVTIQSGAFANGSLPNSTIQIGDNKDNPSNWDVFSGISYSNDEKNITEWIRFYMCERAKLLYYTNQYSSWTQVIKTFTNGTQLYLIDIIADAPSYLAEIRLQNGDHYDDWAQNN